MAYGFLRELKFSLLLHKYLGAGLLDCMARACLTPLRNYQTVLQVTITILHSH